MTKVSLNPSNYSRIEYGALGPADLKKRVDVLAEVLIATMTDLFEKEEYKSLGEGMLDELKETLAEDIKESATLAFKNHMNKQTHQLF